MFSANQHYCDVGESFAFRVTQSAVHLRHLGVMRLLFILRY